MCMHVCAYTRVPVCFHLDLERHLLVKTNSVHSSLWLLICFSKTGLCPSCNLNYKGSVLPVQGNTTMPLFHKVATLHPCLFQETVMTNLLCVCNPITLPVRSPNPPFRNSQFLSYKNPYLPRVQCWPLKLHLRWRQPVYMNKKTCFN